MSPTATTLIFEIAPLRHAERVRWGELWNEYQHFYKVDLPKAATENTWQGIHDGRVHGLGARNADSELVGIVHFLFHADTWSTSPACYLQDLYVDPKTRGRGCALGLIEAVARSAKAAGASDPYWLTHETNKTARQLYDRLAKNQGFLHYVYAGVADALEP